MNSAELVERVQNVFVEQRIMCRKTWYAGNHGYSIELDIQCSAWLSMMWSCRTVVLGLKIQSSKAFNLIARSGVTYATFKEALQHFLNEFNIGVYFYKSIYCYIGAYY